MYIVVLSVLEKLVIYIVGDVLMMGGWVLKGRRFVVGVWRNMIGKASVV